MFYLRSILHYHEWHYRHSYSTWHLTFSLLLKSNCKIDRYTNNNIQFSKFPCPNKYPPSNLQWVNVRKCNSQTTKCHWSTPSDTLITSIYSSCKLSFFQYTKEIKYVNLFRILLIHLQRMILHMSLLPSYNKYHINPTSEGCFIKM